MKEKDKYIKIKHIHTQIQTNKYMNILTHTYKNKLVYIYKNMHTYLYTHKNKQLKFAS